MPSIAPERYRNYARFQKAVDPLADAVAAAFAQRSAGSGRRMLDTAIEKGIDAVDDPPPALLSKARSPTDTAPPMENDSGCRRNREPRARCGERCSRSGGN